jgi:hypothetical protein
MMHLLGGRWVPDEINQTPVQQFHHFTLQCWPDASSLLHSVGGAEKGGLLTPALTH